MEQSAFLFNLNQERIEMTKTLKNIVKHIISYVLLMKQHGLSVGSMALKQHVHRHLYKFFQDVCTFFSGSVIVVVKNVYYYVNQIIEA